ncbi:MAG: penicillin-binding protein 2 [Candidatus Aminicenantes bacterium]|nr:penicillin-binding protein 2 [Candidatus Aminicenantes bacterium]
MTDKGIYEDFSLVRRRAKAAFFAVGLLCAFALIVYWKIQILDYRKFESLALANRTRDIVLPAPRAILTDRTGTVVLADNRAAFKASFLRDNTRDESASIRRIAALLGLGEDVVATRVEKYKIWPRFRPIVVKDNLSFEEVARIEARKNDLPELIVEAEPRRIYPHATLASHALGYLQEADVNDLKTHPDSIRAGDMVGKMGIEGEYNERIAGREGKLVEIVDSLGRSQGELERTEPQPGQRLALTLDFELQAKAEEILAGREGAVVVLDPVTGDVLALASYPNYNPNKFINRFTPEEWQDLARNPDNPLLDRALQGLYSPGSLFKPVMGLAALATGAVGSDTIYFCGGVVDIYGAPRHCWNEAGHGALNLRDAIRYSCNIYFYQLGRRIPIDTIARYAGLMGLGRKTGIDIPGEKDGLVPSTEWKKTVRREDWYPGETISVAIGQGPLQTTPIQIAAMTARLANRGTAVRPHLLMGESGAVEDDAASSIPGGAFDQVIEGMWRSVNGGGTGAAAQVEGFQVCGKTGSTQTISRETAERIADGAKIKKTHSWFTGFAPRTNPRVVVTVLVEYGGGGGATAAPLAGQLFEFFKQKHDRPRATSGN